MRIAFLADALDLQHAGVHVYLRGLLKALAEVDKKNEYLLVRPREGGLSFGMREILLPIKSWIPAHQRLRAFTSIPNALKKESLDVVVEPAHFGPFALPKTIKRITVIHDLTPVLFPQWHVFPSPLVHRLFLPGILKRAHRVIVNSKNTEADLWEKYPISKGKTNIVMPGVDPLFKPTMNADVLQKYGITRPYLLCVGTIEPRKNLLILLKAYEKFRRQSASEYQLVLAGKKGWKNEAFFAALNKSIFKEDIILTGYTDGHDLPALFSMSEVFIYPSLYEGFGLPVLEAMSCGTPVLISDSSSLPEVGGEAAVYFENGNEEDLIDKMQSLLNDKNNLASLRKKSLARAAQFTYAKMAEQFLTAINR